MSEKVSTRELGLILGTRLLKTEDLHYGYWTPELTPSLANLPRAQQAYTDFLLSHIPPGVQRILDVGCGTGHLAQVLSGKGYTVEAVSPSPTLTRMARQRLGESVPVHEARLEELALDRTFDLVLFAESFQYIPYATALAQAHRFLASGGHVLLSDFFSTGAPGRSALRGGHRLDAFRAHLATQPFEVLQDLDITEQTAPNMQVVDAWLRDYAQPLWETLGWYFRTNRPWLGRLGRLFFGRKLDKLHHKYFSGERNAEAFKVHKAYHLMLLRRTD